MDNRYQKNGLDFIFRKHVLHNVIFKKLKELADNTENPEALSQLIYTAMKIEENMFNKATTKDDYLAEVQVLLNVPAYDALFDALVALTARYQMMNTLIERQAFPSNYAQRNADGSCSLQQNYNMFQNEPQVLQTPMPASTAMQQGNIIIEPDLNNLQRQHQFRHQNIPTFVQQYCSMKESKPMLFIENRQQPTQLLTLSGMSLQEQRIQNLGPRLHGSPMPSPPVYYRTLVGMNKHNPQPQMTSRKAPSAFVSVPDAESINTADWKLLINQHRRARSTYLPELVKLLKRAKKHYLQKHIMVIQRMIKFLHASESELLQYSKECITECLNKLIQYVCPFGEKSTASVGNQETQFSYFRHQVTPSVSTTLISDPISQMPENRTSHSQPSPLHPPRYGSLLTTKQVDMKTLQHQGPEGIAVKNTHLNVKQKPQQSSSSSVNQPPKILRSKKSRKLPNKKDDFMNSMFPPMTNATSRTSRQKSSGACLMSARLRQHVSASSVLGPRAKSQPKDIDSPSTSITPSSATKDIRKPAKSISPMKFQAIKAQCATEIHSVSKEALRSSMDDIASAVNAVNKLPAYAIYDNLGKFSPAIYYSTGNGSCRKKSRKEFDNNLMNEIKETNQKLIETMLEVDFNSITSNGTIVKCTYKPVPCRENIKRHFTFMKSLVTLSIEILVPSNYPNTPLKILDRLSVRYCKETNYLLEKARIRFDHCIRGLALVSLGEMAWAWDNSARSSVSEFAHCLGGETFSSKYGSWECVPAV